MQWQACSPSPLPWFALRQLLLNLLHTPHLLLPAAGLALLLLLRQTRLPRTPTLGFALLGTLALSAIYSPAATEALTGWLLRQVPPASPTATGATAWPVLVIPGRGPAIAAATTAAAAPLLLSGQASTAYIYGDQPATAQLLLQRGIPPARIAGDSCARTTWENTTRTAAWLQQHHPGAPVLLLTDPWQLPRATRAFQHQGLQVIPLSVSPTLPPAARNRLALRETAATLLYRLQGRF